MAISSHKSADRLISRYLDPGKRWDARSETALRTSLREDDTVRERYRRAVTAHRLMVGADPQFPSGFEERRMCEALVESVSQGATAKPIWRRSAVWGALVVGAAAALLVTLQPTGDLVSRLGGDRAPATDLRTRGGGTVNEAPALGIGLSGVTRAGD